ncbi:MAG: hypothetical protein H6933_11870 [Burkholderiaceae bacterium]|nr:hypothetical protein [Burkholderiaceae bacterium]
MKLQMIADRAVGGVLYEAGTTPTVDEPVALALLSSGGAVRAADDPVADQRTVATAFDRIALSNHDGYSVALSEAVEFTKITASGLLFSGECEFTGWDCIAGAGGTITVYDATSADPARVAYPTTTLVAGRTAFSMHRKILRGGCYVALSGAGPFDIDMLVEQT